MDLQDKVVIVTGGGTGIGLGIATACIEAGAAVVLAQEVRNFELAEEAAENFRSKGYRALAVATDITRRGQVQALIMAAVEQFGKLDVMVNNAALTGTAHAGKNVLEETDEHWQMMLDVNLTGTFICLQEAARQMVKQGQGGCIISISSVAQFAAQENAVAYCAAKSGLDGMNKVAAIDLAPHNIRCVLVAPGDIYTQASADVVEAAQDRGSEGKYFRYTPLNRRGSVEEIGRVVAFLASDAASFVTGCTWQVDGGFLSY